MDDGFTQESKAPFNMAIATLYSLRKTLDLIRDIEGRIDYPPEERQRIKIELVKRFYVDSSPLLYSKGTTIFEEYKYVLDFCPIRTIFVNRSNNKRKERVVYSFELNKQLDQTLQELQVELQKRKYYMPPSDDMGTIGSKMS